ncbi:MAG: FkbM family methyltransferase [Hyphomicrobium sp.]|uniref:FkbM family methyltransferase n=1 Tax=Hyphomicrobium sp. TaxID=82 RepID=UPI003D0F69B2
MQQPADLLASILGLGRRTAIVDIGANPIDSDPPYKRMLSLGLCDLIGFEPQTDALTQLNARKGPHETYLPYAVGDGQEHTLHICLASGMASLLEPDPQGLELFPEFPRWGSVQGKETMATVRLDDVAEITDIDFLKIDVQGGELSVFRGGRAKLAKAVAIQTEISFIPLYKNQPPFGEIDIELRSLGFVPHTFAALNRRMLAPLRGASPFDHLNQLMEADIVYVRDFRDMASMSKDQLSQLAMIAHHVYKSFDLTVRCLVQLATLGSVQSINIENYINAVRSGSFT